MYKFEYSIRNHHSLKENRHKTLQTKAPTPKETDNIREENFRRSGINNFKEIKEKIRNIKNYHPDVLEIKNSRDALSSRRNILEETRNDLEDRLEECSKVTMQMAKQIIKKDPEIEERSRCSNIHLTGIPEKDNKGNGAEEITNN